MSLLWDFFTECALPVVVVLLIGGAAIIGIACCFDYLDCRGFQRGTGMQTRWAFGCYVETADGWVPKPYVFGRAQELRLKDKR